MDPFRLLPACCLAAVLSVCLIGCSEEPSHEAADSVAGKTPVVRPEDVQGQGAGGAVVLAPDYRQQLAAGTTEPPAAGKGAGKVQADSGAGRLLAGKQTPPAATGASQPPSAAKAEPVRSGPEAGRTEPRTEPAAGPASTGFPVVGCRQLVLVLAPDFGAVKGTVRRLERDGPDAPWREVGNPAACVLGRNGLGVGRGLTSPMAGPAKRQGDSRTPAGLFPLPETFGYATPEEASAGGVRLPYVVVTDRTSCVTDPGSALFGHVVGAGQRPAGVSLRQDRMVRDDGANVWGVVIGHNRDQVDPEAGTCLFVNVRPAEGPPTGGSIGCVKDVAATLVAWLDPAAGPLLAVLPRKEYQERKAAWGLP
jgi:L,D-peptidoglycan transpeptidase YkuD (ErfK/YbiS/YcfS/YnhG family)